MKEIPVYLFLGFLESGKTKFIQDTLCDERFNSGEKTLLLVCEEGMEEYDPALFPYNNVYIEYIDDETLLTRKNLKNLSDNYDADRVIVEYNGMWMLDSLLNNMPRTWNVAQCMMFADATTFLTYNTNIRTQMFDKLRLCELVVFNRVTEATEKLELHKIVRGVNRRSDIAYEHTDGSVEYDEFEDPLPYDIDAPVIELNDKDYAIFYRDLLDETDKYHGKKIKFKGIAAYDNRFPDNIFVAGRHVMTCCIEDVEYRPIVCINPVKHHIKSRDWLMVTGTIKNEYCKFYREKGPVIYIEDIAITSKPQEEIATIY